MNVEIQSTMVLWKTRSRCGDVTGSMYFERTAHTEWKKGTS